MIQQVGIQQWLSFSFPFFLLLFEQKYSKELVDGGGSASACAEKMSPSFLCSSKKILDSGLHILL